MAHPGAAEIKTVPSRSLFPDGSSTVIATGRDFEYGTCANEFSFRRAEPSGLLVLDPRPADSTMGVIYPSTYEPYRFDQLPSVVRTAREFVQGAKAGVIRKLLGERARILDVGCGNGALLRLLRSKGSSGWELHANEMHDESLKALRSEGFQVHEGEVQGLKLDGHFDMIILNQVIEHLSQAREVVRATARLLRKDGVLFIETPSFEGLDARLFSRRHWGGYHFPRHFYIFNETLLTRLVEDEGFAVDRVQYLASPAFWIQSIHHLLLDAGFSRLSSLFTIRNPLLLAIFTFLDQIAAVSGARTSNMRLIARRK